METTSISSAAKKLASILFFLTIFYLIPLSMKPELLISWQVIFQAVICTALFLSQPRLSFAESKAQKNHDRNTIWLIISISGMGQILSILEWAYFWDIKTASMPITIFGMVLMIGGTAFRIYAIQCLGKYFSTTVQIKNDHKIITKGPYRYLRHPSYTGAYIAMAGNAFFLGSVTGMIILTIGMLFVYRQRIDAEEKTLLQNFKDEYANYSMHTYKMFPLFW